jgi:hypothetical protein
MTDWRHEWRKCHCGETFRPKREAQRFCTERCRDADKKHRKRSGDKMATPTRTAGQLEAGTHPPRSFLQASGTAPRWSGLRGTSTTAQPLEPSKAMTTRSNIMRTAAPSCPRVLIVEACLSHLRRRHKAPGTTCWLPPKQRPGTHWIWRTFAHRAFSSRGRSETWDLGTLILQETGA